jgi:hypothetical protein
MRDRVDKCRERVSQDLSAARVAIREASSEAREYGGEVRKALPQTGNSATNDIQDSRALATFMADYLKRVDRSTATQEKAAQRVLADSSSVVELLKQLRKVALASKLVTLNAAAWSERLAGNGAVALIVENMGRLNTDIANETSAIAAAARELINVLPVLAERVAELRSLSQGFIADCSRQAQQVEENLQLLGESAREAARRGDERGQAVQHAAEDALRRLECDAAFERCFNRLYSILERCDTVCTTHSAADDPLADASRPGEP